KKSPQRPYVSLGYFNDSMITATAAILIDFCLLTHGFCPLTAEVPLLFMLAMQSVNLGSTDDEHY
ncbi:hypothetical protein Lpp7_05516, partial [Lacticaseibacillus paracasei subsp. paracasei Lpp7]